MKSEKLDESAKEFTAPADLIKSFKNNEFIITGPDAEDINANSRATVSIRMSLSEGLVLLDQNKKQFDSLKQMQEESLLYLYKKSKELQAILEVAASKLGVDLKQPGWQFDAAKLRLFRA